MANLNLEPGEYAVTQLSDISVNRSALTNDLILTNRHLYVVNKTLFGGRTKKVQKYRIDQIPVINGQAQLKIEKLDGQRQFTIQLKTGEALEILSGVNDDFADFAGHINMLLTGTATVPAERSRTTADQVAETFQSAFAMFDPRTYLGGKKDTSNRQQQPVAQTPQATSRQCVGCHAPISGYTGQVVTCGYCDTEQRL